MMTRIEKEQEVTVIAEKLKKAKAAFLIDFKGMKVSQVTDLRKKLNPVDSEMKVIRNTLAKRALKEFPEMDQALSASFKGTNAIIFAYGDVSASAKALTQFSTEVEVMQLKTGMMDGKAMDQKKIQFLSTLPGKDVLRAQLLGVLQAPGTRLARTLKEVSASLVRVLAAREE